jgi:hypothetical protein
MIVLKNSSFVLFVFLIIISTITVYNLVQPYTCSCDKKKINIYRGKVKYVPVIIKKDIEKILESKEKKCSPPKKNNSIIPKKENNNNSSSIGGHSSTHGGSIVPSKWIDDDEESSFKFKY